MTSHDFQRTAQGFSRMMVTVGAIILMVCVGFLTYTWWRDGRWLWVALGIALIVVNIAMLVMTYRKAKLTPPRPLDDEDDDDDR
ncbi:hypothetical protein [Gordonia sp. NB41Y]|uniref:hypothetical protein n=1 Tax=Gordonia sp. NB41Y TaxID=875808 RepID=UPI000345CF02|nr:hypothetical protein [Gordonia sp. NB41Y]EMP12647.2 hypothetical protein ISGA_1173 [Gordonia sp. NB41Y]WLP88962.1 hypothetical protein Q9K23_15260 [Gordonia sp. NB41Y]